jgi:hypothetical protein
MMIERDKATEQSRESEQEAPSSGQELNPDREGAGATSHTADDTLSRGIESAIYWVLGSAQDLSDLLERLLPKQGNARALEGLRSFLRGLIPDLDELHERLHDLVLAGEAWEVRLTAEDSGGEPPVLA